MDLREAPSVANRSPRNFAGSRVNRAVARRWAVAGEGGGDGAADRGDAEIRQCRNLVGRPDRPAGEQLLALECAVLGPEHVKLGETMGWLALLQQRRSDFDAAESWRKREIEHKTRLLGASHWKGRETVSGLDFIIALRKMSTEERRQIDETRTWGSAADAFEKKRQPAKAIEEVEKILEVRKRLLGERHLGYALTLERKAGLLQDTGASAKAEAEYRRAVELFAEVLGEGHPRHAFALNRLALFYREIAAYEQAEPPLRRALELARASVGENHPMYAGILNNLAALYYDQGVLHPLPLFSKKHTPAKENYEILDQELGAIVK